MKRMMIAVAVSLCTALLVPALAFADGQPADAGIASDSVPAGNVGSDVADAAAGDAEGAGDAVRPDGSGESGKDASDDAAAPDAAGEDSPSADSGPASGSGHGSDAADGASTQPAAAAAQPGGSAAANAAETQAQPAAAEAGASEASEARTGLEGFVERLYRLVLQREPDAGGFAWQVDAMRSGLAASQVSMNFFCSPEFGQAGHSNSEQVEIAYRTMLDRDGDAEGRALWQGYLDNGMSIASVVKGFSQAREFVSLCDSWGVACGTVEVTEARDRNPQVTAFATRMYRIALNREPDINGLNVQCNALLEGTSGGQLARGFFLSGEFSQSGYVHAISANCVYRAMLDREADESGLAYWVGYLDAGMTMDALICGFNRSSEFSKLCERWEIVVAPLNPTRYRDQNFEVTKFVRGGYTSFLVRTPSGSELDHWCAKLLTGEGACEVMEAFACSSEFMSRNLGNADSVKAVYGAMLEREGDAAGIQTWCAFLDRGNTLLAVVDGIADSDEFSRLCARMGVTRRVYQGDPYSGAFQGVSSATPYLIIVDCDCHRVTIYEENGSAWRAVRVWSCADGAPGMETVKGWFTVGIRGYCFDSGSDRCFYYTQFCGDYLFHSVLYAQTDSPEYITDGRLGVAVSHGCVRLAVENAQWIYENIPEDTTVYVF